MIPTGKIKVKLSCLVFQALCFYAYMYFGIFLTHQSLGYLQNSGYIETLGNFTM